MATAWLPKNQTSLLIMAGSHAFLASILATIVVTVISVVIGFAYGTFVGPKLPGSLLTIMTVVSGIPGMVIGAWASHRILSKVYPFVGVKSFASIATAFLVVGCALDISLDTLELYAQIPRGELAAGMILYVLTFFLTTRHLSR